MWGNRLYSSQLPGYQGSAAYLVHSVTSGRTHTNFPVWVQSSCKASYGGGKGQKQIKICLPHGHRVEKRDQATESLHEETLCIHAIQRALPSILLLKIANSTIRFTTTAHHMWTEALIGFPAASGCPRDKWQCSFSIWVSQDCKHLFWVQTALQGFMFLLSPG